MSSLNYWEQAKVNTQGTNRGAANAEYERLKALGGTTDANGVYHDLALDGSDHQASNAAADITRNKYDDWKTRFFPKVDELMNLTTYMNPGLVGTETAKAVDLTNQSFDTVGASQNRNIARFGMTQTAEQQQAQESALALGRSAATVNADNSTRLALRDRDRAIATGGLGGTA